MENILSNKTKTYFVLFFFTNLRAASANRTCRYKYPFLLPSPLGSLELFSRGKDSRDESFFRKKKEEEGLRRVTSTNKLIENELRALFLGGKSAWRFFFLQREKYRFAVRRLALQLQYGGSFASSHEIFMNCVIFHNCYIFDREKVDKAPSEIDWRVAGLTFASVIKRDLDSCY